MVEFLFFLFRSIAASPPESTTSISDENSVLCISITTNMGIGSFIGDMERCNAVSVKVTDKNYHRQNPK